MSSIEPFNRLVKLTARAFYYDDIPKGENPTKAGRGDNRGIAVVILDALTRRQWVREEDLAKDLKVHTKQLRRALRFFEEEKLITRDHRKETAKGVKVHNAAVAATADAQHNGRGGDDKIKLHTHSYCCLDYSQIYDIVRYRLQRMRKKLKDELDSRNKIQVYICSQCIKRYTALDALRLISLEDEYFHCERCNTVLVAESDAATELIGDGDDNARRCRQEKIKDMLRKMEEQLKPLVDQLGRIKDLPVPEFGNLQAWELRANAAGRANGNYDANDSKNSQGFGGTPMPYLGDTKVEVAFSDEKGDIKSAKPSAPSKPFPAWMMKEGMNLTKEQRAEAKSEENTTDLKTALELSDDKKSTVDEESKNIQDEYVKAYYAALLLRNQRGKEETFKLEEESSKAVVSNERRVGVKSKREDDDEGGDVEWEDSAPPIGSTSENIDLNVEAATSDPSDDEDIWEEG